MSKLANGLEVLLGFLKCGNSSSNPVRNVQYFMSTAREAGWAGRLVLGAAREAGWAGHLVLSTA